MFDQIDGNSPEQEPGRPLVIAIGIVVFVSVIVLIYMTLLRDSSKDGTYSGTFANDRGKLSLVIQGGVVKQLDAGFNDGECSGSISKYSTGFSELVWNNRFDFAGSAYGAHGTVSFRVRGFFDENGRLSGWITMSGPAANTSQLCQLSGEWFAARI